MTAALQVSGLHHGYFNRGQYTEILQDISFSVPKGSFVCIVGPSGAGKTTLFNLLARFMPVQKGTILLDGSADNAQRDKLGYMLQKDLLFPWRTILDNVLLGLDIHRRRDRRHIERAHEYLRRYGLEGYAHAYPNQLSGGMRQRAALIRTLMIEPSLILLDEPFSALDYQTRLLLENELFEINRREHRTMMLVTHDIGEAISLADRVIVLSHRPAHVKAIHEIHLTISGTRTPWEARKAPEYHTYFDILWQELGLQMEIAGRMSASGSETENRDQQSLQATNFQ